MSGATIQAARETKPKVLDLFESKVKVSAIGITRYHEGYGIKVNLVQEPRPGLHLPVELDGVPIVIKVTGPAEKHRPDPK